VALLLAFLLGAVSGLRTFTAPAVLWVMRHRSPWAYVLAAAALFEYFFDLHPNAPPRSAISNVVGRLISGAFVGWWAATAGNSSPTLGSIAGVAGALAGTYGGLALRRQAIKAIGNHASGLFEDIVAIAASIAIVAQL
jgi:uncharacterized membrane protein